MSHDELFKQDYINAALDRYKFKNLEEMYASVGFGAISQVKIISRMLEEYRKSHKEENIEQKIEELTNKRKNIKPSSTGVVVKE
ncbi:MAG: RelA/SpoT AH/RIS domain-containing protein [Clostridia bacterium]